MWPFKKKREPEPEAESRPDEPAMRDMPAEPASDPGGAVDTGAERGLGDDDAGE